MSHLIRPRILAMSMFLVVAACTPPPVSTPTSGPATATPTAAPTVAASPTPVAPAVPAPVAVNVDPKTTALLVLDVTSVVCTPRPACVASVPKIANLLKSARDAKALVVYSDTPTAGSTILAAAAPQAGEPKVTSRADKFFGTDLEKILKDRGIQTVVIVGSAANGAVLYTSFGANARGFTAVVAEDGISVGTGDEFGLTFTRWQLLQQPGFANPENKPLEKGRVTVSRSDLIGFGTAAPGTAGGTTPLTPTTTSLPALSAVAVPATKTAILALDLINVVCDPRPQCVASLPKIAEVLKRGRAAGATVVYSLTPTPGATVRSEVKPESGETSVISRADKFFDTNLDQFLKSKGITYVVIVGTVAHGAVLYTSFGANLRGYTVIVPVEGMSVGPGEDFGLLGAKWQLLNQPGFANATNTPLAQTRVTLSALEGVTFEK